MTPIIAITPNGVPVTANPINTPVKANGKENIIMKGSVRDSNCAANTINTSIMIIIPKIVKSLNVSC